VPPPFAPLWRRGFDEASVEGAEGCLPWWLGGPVLRCRPVQLATEVWEGIAAAAQGFGGA
jgi:hypothetical protein